MERRLQPASVVVWIVWGAMTAALLACVWAFTFNLPLAEDWHMVSPLTGHEPSLWTWLWAQNNEHRLPLPRLLLLGVLRVTPDFRAGMVANIAVMAGASWVLLRMLAAARGGRLRYTDAFIPMALLHIGNWENFMWAWELCFVLSAGLVLVLLVPAGASDLWTARWRAWLAAAVIAALPLCGANGMAFAAPMGAWLAFEATVQLRLGPERRHAASIVLIGIAVAAAGSAYYFVGYTRATWNPPSPSVLATVKTALKFLALGFGPIVSRAAGAGGLVTLALLLVAALLVLRRTYRDVNLDERLRSLRLIAYVGAMGGLALAFGWGRAGLVPVAGLPDRYVLLAAPAIVWIYVVADLYARTATRRVLQGAMLAIACVLLPFNIRDGFEWRDWYRDGMQSVVRDIDAGLSREEIVARHRAFLMAWSPERLSAGIAMLHDARIGPFGRLSAPAAALPSSAGDGRPLRDRTEAARAHP